MVDYRKTLNLLTTKFPMKADLPHREPGMLVFWEKVNLYQKMLARNRGKPIYILHDGPPYSNGHVHLGTALNKILKDIVVKFKAMAGHLTPMVPGWDNHGMPIENEIVREFREKKLNLERSNVRQECRKFAAHWVEIQREEFKRLGVTGEWSNPYLTMSKEYEGRILEVFADLVERGYIYRSPRPVHWCIVCKTSLANIEIEYRNKTSYSLWIRFLVVADPDRRLADLPKDKTFALVWTTTPWTIPANLAISLHPDFTYVVIREAGNYYLLARNLLEASKNALGFNEAEIVKEFKGEELAKLVFRHPIFSREAKTLLGDFVTGDQGTGCVHTAPGHGHDDFEIGRRYNLPIFCPVDEAGRFTDEAGEFAGLELKEGDLAVMAALKREGTLLKQDTIEHSYPFCWRCHNPLIFRTTLQWYMNIDHHHHRQNELKVIEDVRWFPARSFERIKSFVSNQPDWCLSRQRFWGVGIPAFYCNKCGEAILNASIIRQVAELVKEFSAEVWYDDEKIKQIFKDITCPKCKSQELTKEKDILDVWFDSSCSSFVVLFSRPDHRWPANLYLEGSDQHRGWFSLSLTVGMAVRETPPFNAVITHGFVLDKNGLAMHKSLGNAISPQEVVDRHGADVLRLWTASSEYFDDVRCSEEILDRVVEAYRKIRNTFRFLLTNTADFDYDKDKVADQNLHLIDRYMRSRWQKIIGQINTHYNNFEFHKVYHLLSDFCVIDLSSLYLDVLKDRLYTWSKNSPGRRAAQTVLYEILDSLLLMLAPILSFTTEEVFQLMPNRKSESVFLNDFPKSEKRDEKLEAEFEELLKVRELVFKRLEVERQAKTIGSGLEAKILINSENDTLNQLLKKYSGELATLFIVSQVELVSKNGFGPNAIFDDNIKLGVDYKPADGSKCGRCWIYSPDVGKATVHPELCGKCVGALEEK